MDSELKFDIQTEGLGQFWGITPGRNERIMRDPMTVDEIRDIILSILEENETEANCQIFLKRGIKKLEIQLVNGSISISDPANVNYQNISVSIDDLESSILSFFKVLPQDEEQKRSGAGLVQWTIAIVAGTISFATFNYAIRFLQRDFQFMPKPEFIEVENKADYNQHLREMAGIYITEWEDGETLLSLKNDGRWEFYDIERGRNQKFLLDDVEGGIFRPIYQKGRLALLTENFYVFRWESEGVLSFQERRYIRTANSEDEVPFITFPN